MSISTRSGRASDALRIASSPVDMTPGTPYPSFSRCSWISAGTSFSSSTTRTWADITATSLDYLLSTIRGLRPRRQAGPQEPDAAELANRFESLVQSQWFAHETAGAGKIGLLDFIGRARGTPDHN